MLQRGEVKRADATQKPATLSVISTLRSDPQRGSQSIVGSTMGSIEELRDLTDLLVETGIRPIIDRVLPLRSAREAFVAMDAGEVRGKLVLTP